MLVLRRRPGQFIEVTHVASGERCRIHVARQDGRGVDLGLEDSARLFDFQRPERKLRPVAPFPPETPPDPLAPVLSALAAPFLVHDFRH